MTTRAPAATIVLIALSACLAGCAVRADLREDALTDTTTSPATTPTAPARPDEVTVDPAPGEVLLGSMTSVRGLETMNISPGATGRLAVYARCVGEGTLDVRIDDIVAMTQHCTGESDVGTRNTITGIAVDGPVAVTGSAEPSDIWAVAVTEVPAP